MLITAALTAAGALTSMAQVYSVNSVGYTNLTIPKGFSMIANQLNASPDNTIGTILPAPPNNTFIFKFNGSSFDSYNFVDGTWDDPSPTLGPGEGCFISVDPNFAPTGFTATFVGEVSASKTISMPLAGGFSIVSSPVPQSGLNIDGAPPAGLGFPTANGDMVFRFTGLSFNSYDYEDGAWTDDNDPQPNIGESFFIYTGAGHTAWTRNFSVALGY